VWILPRLESELRTCLLGRATAQVQEWPQQMAGSGCHPGQRSAARSTSQAQQHRLGLVVEGVTEQHGGGTGSGLGIEGQVSGLAGRCLGPDGRRPVHLNGGNSHVVIAKPVELLLDASRNLG
jgi:hypothetical protein